MTADLPREPIPGTPRQRARLTHREVGVTLGRRAGLLVFLTALAGGAAAVIALLLPDRFTAETAIIAESKGPSIPGGLVSLAAMAGVDVSGTAAETSPQFYTSLLRSRAIQHAILMRRFPAAFARDSVGGADSVALLDLLEVEGATRIERLTRGAKKLAKATRVDSEMRTNIIRLAFTHRSARLAADVANAYVDELNRFNRETRQLRAGARRRFVEARVEEAANDLSLAEMAVRDFLSSNRQYQESPALRFEFQRLERALGVQQELYLELRRQLDAARIAEVDDTPTVTTIEPALAPYLKSWPPRKKLVLGAMAAAFVLSAAVVVLARHRQALVPGLVAAWAGATAGRRHET